MLLANRRILSFLSYLNYFCEWIDVCINELNPTILIGKIFVAIIDRINLSLNSGIVSVSSNNRVKVYAIAQLYNCFFNRNPS